MLRARHVSGYCPVVVWGCQAVLLAVLALRGRWKPALRRVDVGLAMGVFALLLLIDAGIKLYRGVNRMLPPAQLRSEAP